MNNRIDDGGPAFPAHPSALGDHDGMTLRDYLAAHASEEDVNEQAEVIRLESLKNFKVAALPNDWRMRARYMHADAMLKARQK